jgi:hypothetical protein
VPAGLRTKPLLDCIEQRLINDRRMAAFVDQIFVRNAPDIDLAAQYLEQSPAAGSVKANAP